MAPTARTEHPASNGAMKSAGQKPTHRLIWTPKKPAACRSSCAIRGDIENAEHAEDDGQAACHQNQRRSVQNAVQRGYDDKTESTTLHLREMSRPRSGECRSAGSSRGDARLISASICRWWGAWSAPARSSQLAASPNRSFPRRTPSGAIAKQGDLHGLEELVIVLPHHALATVIDVGVRPLPFRALPRP